MFDIFKLLRFDRRHRIQTKQLKPRHAKMHAVDGPVMKTGDAEGAAIANTLGEDFPAVGEVVAILSGDDGNFGEVLRLSLAGTERNSRLQLILPVPANVM